MQGCIATVFGDVDGEDSEVAGDVEATVVTIADDEIKRQRYVESEFSVEQQIACQYVLYTYPFSLFIAIIESLASPHINIHLISLHFYVVATGKSKPCKT